MMPKTMIFEGKTSNEAIEKGLKELKVSKDKVDIKILEEDKRSFFSILTPRVVKVEMTLKEDKKTIKREKVKIDENERIEAVKIIESFVKELVENLPKEELIYDVKTKDDFVEVNINGKNISYLIGYRGETLNSLQTILNSVLKNKMKTGLRVILDICGYKEERKKTLEDLAVRVAGTVVKTGKTITLDPMRPYERKIIHSKLQENSKIRTHSVGEEPYRKIVISLKK